MIMNVQQNAGAPAAPPAAPAPVIIQQEKKSNTCCIVVTTVLCLCVVLPLVIWLILVAVVFSAVSSVASNIDSSDFNLTTPTYSTSTSAPVIDICAGDLYYNVNGAAGSLESPNYPANYPNSMNCNKLIETSSDGITFEINAFATEYGYDKVIFNNQYLFHGTTPQVGDRFSFSATQVDVYFHSDSIINDSGFSFQVIDGYEPANDVANLAYATTTTTTTSPPVTSLTYAGPLSFATDICAGYFKYNVNGTAGSLESPNYPANYPENMMCTNRIETSSDGITFEINAFDIDNNHIVVFNWQYLFQGTTPQVGDRFSFNATQVDVYFESDSWVNGSGFSFQVIDGYEPANDVANLAYATIGRTIINKKELPPKTE